MIKKVVNHILLLLAVIFSASSCALYEDVTFRADGKITYSLTIDTKEFVKTMTPSLLGSSAVVETMSLDSVVSFSEIMDDKGMTGEEKQFLSAIKPFSVRRVENYKDSVFTSSIYGTFDNDKQLNEALIAMNNMFVSLFEGNMEGVFNTPEYISQYSWDGTTMKRYVVKNPLFIEGENRKESAVSEFDEPFTDIIKSGDMKIEYHFLQQVEKTNNTEATFSQDRKTVITDHKAVVFINSPQDANIVISVKK